MQVASAAAEHVDSPCYPDNVKKCQSLGNAENHNLGNELNYRACKCNGKGTCEGQNRELGHEKLGRCKCNEGWTGKFCLTEVGSQPTHVQSLAPSSDPNVCPSEPYTLPAADQYSGTAWEVSWFQTTEDCYGYDADYNDESYSSISAPKYQASRVAAFASHVAAQAGIPSEKLTTFHGLADNGLQLTYPQISDTMRTACKYKSSDKTLKRKAAFNPETGVAGSLDGQVDPYKFICLINAAMEGRSAGANGKGHKTFGIIDHNSGHGWAAPLAIRGFHRQLAVDSKQRDQVERILVNFDNHIDYMIGVTSSPCPTSNRNFRLAAPTVRCNNWADFVMKANSKGSVCDLDYYLFAGKDAGLSTTGRSSKTNDWSTMQLFKCVGGVITKIELTDRSMNKNLATIKTELGTEKAIHLYVSIDRDVQVDSYTPWNDGGHTQKDVQDSVKIMAVANSKLVGFDVCGVPSYGQAPASGIVSNAANKLFYADIKTYWELATAH